MRPRPPAPRMQMSSAPPTEPAVTDDDPTYVGLTVEPEGRFEIDKGKPKSTAGYVVVVAQHNEPPSVGLPLPFVREPDSIMAAGYRVLRHRLREAGSPTTIAITSPGPKEGKSTCAINLAMAYAEHARERVLLLEANLRSPRIAKALGFVPPSCFGEQMASHLRNPMAPWNVVAAFMENFHVLAVHPESIGKWIFSAPGFRLAIDQLKGSGYGHIIVDCPPALGSADVNVVEDSTDGVLLVALARKTSGDSLKKAADHLAPANIFGTVMLGA